MDTAANTSATTIAAMGHATRNLALKALEYGIPGVQAAFSSYLLWEAWRLSSKTKRQLQMKKKSLYSWSMANSIVHRFCGGAFLVHSIYNAVAVLRGKSMSKGEAVFVFSISGLSTLTIFPLLSDVAYSNTRIHRFFAISQYSSIQFLIAAVSEASYVYYGNTLTTPQRVLIAAEALWIASMSVVMLLDLVDSVSILVSNDKNQTVLKKRESRSFRQPLHRTQSSAQDYSPVLKQRESRSFRQPLHRTQSSAQDYSPANRVMVRSYQKIFQKTLRNDSEEHNTSVRRHPAAVFAALITGFVPVIIFAGRFANKWSRNEKYVGTFEDLGWVVRIGLPPFAFNIIAPFTWTLYVRGSISHETAKTMVLTAAALLASWPMYPMIVNGG
eukprot:CAMPEP_0202730528 /NCGR_PEP_ID=MMETSP1385-20130828/186685_1 /ASSEMBLY_ACC=CAM_ASM_000861 /TAXON_ID=933848 /ORGANISM="Elphidium margaritaceum" /LENGTH=384 /DNA_ID=CAMNT_0049396803 /DNA_START=33 /DNA_END=1184 /DNA_ORIENTATION=+